MGRPPCHEENGLKKGPWTVEEDGLLVDFIERNGVENWKALPKRAGLNRCGKSCRLRWANYLRPDIKRGNFKEEEEELIIVLHSVVGNKWSQIATHLPGRTDNEIKNFWNTHLRKKLLRKGIDPVTHRPRTELNFFTDLPHLLALANATNPLNPWDNALRVQAEAAMQLAKLQVLHNLLQVISSTTNVVPSMEAINNLLNAHPRSSQTAQFEDIPLALSPNLGTAHQEQNFVSISNNLIGDQIAASKLINTIMDNNFLSESLGSANTIPSLVPASPESSTVNKIERKVSPADISIHSPTSTTFEDWGDFNINDVSNDFSWKDFIEQTTSESWQFSQ